MMLTVKHLGSLWYVGL